MNWIARSNVTSGAGVSNRWTCSGITTKACNSNLPCLRYPYSILRKSRAYGSTTKSLRRCQIEKVTKYVPCGLRARVGFTCSPQRLKPLFGQLKAARLKSCPSRALFCRLVFRFGRAGARLRRSRNMFRADWGRELASRAHLSGWSRSVASLMRHDWSRALPEPNSWHRCAALGRLPYRGAEAPLFHGAAHVLVVIRRVKIKVKGVGQECLVRASNLGSWGICTGLFSPMFRWPCFLFWDGNTGIGRGLFRLTANSRFLTRALRAFGMTNVCGRWDPSLRSGWQTGEDAGYGGVHWGFDGFGGRAVWVRRGARAGSRSEERRRRRRCQRVHRSFSPQRTRASGWQVIYRGADECGVASHAGEASS